MSIPISQFVPPPPYPLVTIRLFSTSVTKDKYHTISLIGGILKKGTNELIYKLEPFIC